MICSHLYVLDNKKQDREQVNEFGIDPQGYFANAELYCRLHKSCLCVNFVKSFVSSCLNS